MDIFWFLPTHGDNRQLGTSAGSRAPTLDYLRQIAEAADRLGFEGALIPTGSSCEDSWVAASSLIAATQRLKFLVAIRPGITSPTLAARMAATFDRYSNGRLLVNLVAGGDPREARADGLAFDHDQRYALAGEFIDIWRRLLAGQTVDHDGPLISVEQARLLFAGVQQPHPPVYLGGSSDAAIALSGEHVDVYLTWGEPPAQVAEKIDRVRAAAATRGRRIRFGIRLHVIVRETGTAAWAAAQELIAPIGDEAIARAQSAFAGFESEGQRRMSALHQGRRDQLEVAPNLWAGVGLVRGGAGTALVGSADEVAERIREYEALGIDTFILSGYPHLEEAYRVAELLFPRLDHLGGLVAHDGLGGPFGGLETNPQGAHPTADRSTDQPAPRQARA